MKKGESLTWFILGDVNDNRKAIDINVSNLTANCLQELAEIAPGYMLTGNHDLSKKTNKGNNSLRPYAWLKDIHIIKDPTVVNLTHKDKVICSIAVIPFLGDFNEETACLLSCKDSVQFAFMHTELAQMTMDNGMTITSGVNPDAFTGVIFAGHIHKHQETKKCIYVGSPFQMSRRDRGNLSGFYLVDFKKKTYKFIVNDYSPKFQDVSIDWLLSLDTAEKRKLLDNNYTFVLIDESQLDKYKKKVDIYNLKAGTTARAVKPIITRNHPEVLSELDISVGGQVQSIDALIIKCINDLDVDNTEKEEIHKMNTEYIKAALSQLTTD